MRIFAYLGGKGGNRIVVKFCIGVGVPDVIIHAMPACDVNCALNHGSARVF